MARSTLYLFSLLLLCGGFANAADCPEFYRFVDFGQTGSDGVVYRGGSFLRAEDFDGTTLLDMQRTECRNVGETNTDGHGYPIPVVSSIDYSPVKSELDLLKLQVSTFPDTRATTEQAASVHRQRLEQSDARITRGENYLCVYVSPDDELSCQVVSPYEGNHALVVYCKSPICDMPVMAINDQLAVSAKWEQVISETPYAAEVVGWIEKIHRFLVPLTSLNPG